MNKIRCVVERITYQNEDSGYCVIKVREWISFDYHY